MQGRRNMTARLGFTLFLLALNTVYLVAAFQIRVQFDEGLVGPKFLPFLASAITYLALLDILRREYRSGANTASGLTLRAPATVVLITAAYVLLFQPLGYIASTFLFAMCLFKVFDFKCGQLIHGSVYASGVTLVFYLLFRVAFNVRMPLVPGIF
jgi:putative tricarboxylic transport membrane protein